MKKIKHDKRCQDICGIVKQIFEISGGSYGKTNYKGRFNNCCNGQL